MTEPKPVLEGAETHIAQVGVVVRDLDRTVEFLTALGLGPFQIRTAVHPSATVHGKSVSYQVRLGLSQQGPVQLELIEYQSGTTIQEEFLREKGEGIHHILFKVRDLKATLEKFSSHCIEVLQKDDFVGGGGLAYMGTDKVGGIIVEVVQHPSDYDPGKGAQYIDKRSCENKEKE
jgi:catechol 2,3-dioxygenase-like lactoylglutathione lyase family enzyme